MASELMGRGVWIAPYLTTDGGQVLVSITSAGRRLAHWEISAGDNPTDTLELMWAELNAKDPPAPSTPALKLA